MNDTTIDPKSNPLEPTQEVSRLDAPYKATNIADVEVAPGEGVLMRSLPQMIEGAKLMARADIALPPHARNRPEICFAIMMRTENWKLRDPFFVAEHSYVVSQKRKVGDKWEEVESLAYDAAVFQASLLASGAIRGRPQYLYEGEGSERKCTISVQDRQTGQWEELTTRPLKDIHPGHNEKGFVKGSPLWDRNPDQQIAYYGLRNLVRLKYQDVLAGFYDKDEYAEYPEIGETPPATPNLLERLPGRIEGDGFKPDTVTQTAEELSAIAKAEELKQERKASRGWPKGKPRGPRKVKSESPAEAAQSFLRVAPDALGIDLPEEAQSEPAANSEASGGVMAQAQAGTRAGLRQAIMGWEVDNPTNKGEYIQYAQTQIKRVSDPTEWFFSDEEFELRKTCQVDDATFNMLRTLVKGKR